MSVGRVVRTVVDSARLETLDDSHTYRSFPVSIFYPTDEQNSVGKPTHLLSLFHAARDDVRTILSKMGLNEHNLTEFPVSIIDNAVPRLTDRNLPVVIFSPAFGIDRDLYVEGITTIVEAGFIIVTVGTPHEGIFTVFPDGRVVRQSEKVAETDFSDFENLKNLIQVRVEDIRNVIDQLQVWNSENNGYYKFDTNRIGVMGHSLGGAAVFKVAASDNRVKCAVLLDASLHLIDHIPFELPLLNVRQQAATLSELLEDMREAVATAYIDGQNWLYKAASRGNNFVKIVGADHMSFSTFGILANGDQSVIRSIQPLCTSFLEEFLAGTIGAYSRFINDHDKSSNVIVIDGDGFES